MPFKNIFARQALAILATGIVVSLSGCGKDSAKLVPVEGQVTVGEKALTKGSVILHPDAARGNLSLELPRGSIDAAGRYTILTHVKGGVAPGWYQVSVTAADQPDPNNPYKFDFLLPLRYIDHHTSGLAFEVVDHPAPGAYDLSLDAK